MADKLEIEKPIEIKDNSEARIAYELMSLIAYEEVTSNGGDYPKERTEDPRAYYIKLYAQSRAVVKNGSIIPKQ